VCGVCALALIVRVRTAQGVYTLVQRWTAALLLLQCAARAHSSQDQGPPQADGRRETRGERHRARGVRRRACQACVCDVVSTLASREELLPSGFTPGPSASAAGCMFDTMSQMPAMYGGLTHDPLGHCPLSSSQPH